MSAMGVAFGSFDMFHVGHLRAIRAALAYGDPLVLAVASDATVAARTGRPPKVAESERAEVLRAFFPDLRVEIVEDDGALGERFGTTVRYVCVPAGTTLPSADLPLVELPYDTTTSESLLATLEADVLWPPAPG